MTQNIIELIMALVVTVSGFTGISDEPYTAEPIEAAAVTETAAAVASPVAPTAPLSVATPVAATDTTTTTSAATEPVSTDPSCITVTVAWDLSNEYPFAQPVGSTPAGWTFDMVETFAWFSLDLNPVDSLSPEIWSVQVEVGQTSVSTCSP